MTLAQEAAPEVRLLDGSLLQASASLWTRRRGERVLVSEPESASWLIVPLPLWRVLCGLERPCTFGALRERHPEVGGEDLLRAVESFYNHQMLSIDGVHRYDPDELWRVRDFPYFITIHLTERCNFACTYCYGEYTTKGDRARLETVKYIIRRVFQEIPLPQVALEFHGGEPLMEFETLVAASRYARELARQMGKKLFIMAQSNGGLITPERAALLKELSVNVGVSIDGTPRMHDKHRVNYNGRGTSEKVWEGVDALRGAGHSVGPLCVIREPGDYQEAFEFFLSRGISDMTLRRVYGSGRARDAVYGKPSLDEEFAEAFLASAQRLRDHNASAGVGAVRSRELESALANVVSKKRHHMCFRSPCGAGNSHIAFDVHGSYYACDEMVGRDEFKIGNIYEDDSLSRALQTSPVNEMLLNRSVQNIPKCRRCPWKYSCGGGCTSRVHSRFGTIHKESHFCRFQELTIEELIWRIDEDPDFVRLVMGPEFMTDEVLANQYKL